MNKNLNYSLDKRFIIERGILLIVGSTITFSGTVPLFYLGTFCICRYLYLGVNMNKN